MGSSHVQKRASLADGARQREGGAMFRLSVVRTLGLVTVVVLILVGGTLFAQSTPLVHEDAKLTASDAEAQDFFGSSVALSGNTAVVGAYRDDHSGANSGSAYVFARNGTSWSEQVKLTASDAEAQDFFGSSVALSGNTAVVGAHRDDHAAGKDAGSAYVLGTVPDDDVPATSDWGLVTAVLLLLTLSTAVLLRRRRSAA